MNNTVLISGVGNESDCYGVFSRFGALYKYGFITKCVGLYRVWFYLRSDFNRCRREMKSQYTHNGEKWKISYSKISKQFNRILRRDKIYEVCNTYLGFSSWTNEIVDVKLIGTETCKINREIKYTVTYESLVCYTFMVMNKDILISFKSAGTAQYTAVDETYAKHIAAKMSVLEATKLVFSRIAFEIKDGLVINIVKVESDIDTSNVILEMGEIEEEQKMDDDEINDIIAKLDD
ncbi:hypothetical protein EIN_326360 [Entamoeba invadens IP1]|uniref:Uncharacterized protein n=1 Tax=Entamoeba invadens IP1 TaxID=370355 RepID=L7FN41_ENTIV|nr:hypothetical protein EIN_326360 [Entamoeba invadens IP1]ELP87565.1 hypothetical protein EIN_326360 [Entamoeba invadens IP1]|eukprot:XP_004254336.1 hypothetical protein EIN_326360 [Entamoeba invadens IP1]